MRRMYAFLVSLVLTLALVTEATASPLSPYPTRTVLVTVIGTNGQPLQGAAVQLLTPGSAAFSITRTNASGRAPVDLPDGFSFWLRVWADGYSLVERPYVPSTDGPVVTLQASAYTASLTGLVTDDRGLPVPNAKVSIWLSGEGLQASAISNAQGRYQVEGLRTGAGYYLQVEARGFQPSVQTDLTLTPGALAQADVGLTAAAGTVTGEVINSRTGRPAPGVRAELLLNGWGVIQTATTDGYGYFRFDAPPWAEDAYQVRLSGSEFETFTTAAFAVAPASWADFTGGNRLSLNPLYAELSGSVLRDNGDPLAKVPVELQRSDLGTVEIGVTDADGYYLFEQIPAGTYRVRAVPDYQEHGASAWVTLSGGDRATADVSANSPDTTSFGQSAIVGTVRDHLGDPVAGAAISARRGSEEYKASTDSRGRYRLSVPANVEDEPIEPETSSGYRVAVVKDGFLSTDLFGTADGAPAPAFVNVRARATNRADFTLQPAQAELAGRVLDSRGRPVDGVEVLLVQEGGGTVASVTTSGTGVYRFGQLPVGKQARYLPVVAGGTYLEGAIAPNGTPIAPTRPTPGGVTTHTLAVRPATGLVQGVVRAGDNQAAAAAPITVVRPADGKTFTGTTADDGSYSISVPAGPGDAYFVRVSQAQAKSGAVPEAVALGTQHAVVANAAVVPHASLRGRVYQPDGQPAPGVEVTLWVEGTNKAVQFVRTDADGYYRFSDLAPGRRYSVIMDTDAINIWSSLAPGEAIITPLSSPGAGETLWADLVAPYSLESQPGGNAPGR